MSDYKTIGEEFVSKGRELVSCCIEHLYEILDKYNDCIDFTKYETDYLPTIIYGKGHNANVDSKVENIYLIGDYPYLDTEDCVEYDAEDCYPLELYDICEFIDTQILPNIKENE